MKIQNWHIASIRTYALNGRYWTHSGPWWALARNGAVANDPTATSGPGEAIGYAYPDTLDIITLQHGER